jgi:hypothetical protein
MDETLPLQRRRELLEKALEDIRAAKHPAKSPQQPAPASERAGRSGSSSPGAPNRYSPRNDNRPKA